MTPEEKILRTQWGTPRWLFNRLHAEYRFTADMAALPHNAKLPHYYGPEDPSPGAVELIRPERDGLVLANWIGERAWCNPPYNRPGDWLELGAQACSLGWFNAFLVPNNWDTDWFGLATQGLLEPFDGRVPHDPPPGVGESSPRGAQMLVVFAPEIFVTKPRARPLVRRRSARTGFLLEDGPWL